MKTICNAADVKKLKVDDKLFEFNHGEVNYYRFLCFHPRNDTYVILLNLCEKPVRFYIDELVRRFYTECTGRDIITYRRDYFLKEAKQCEQALAELGGKENLND